MLLAVGFYSLYYLPLGQILTVSAGLLLLGCAGTIHLWGIGLTMYTPKRRVIEEQKEPEGVQSEREPEYDIYEDVDQFFDRVERITPEGF